VEVANEFEEVWFLFHDDGLVSILEEMPAPLVSPIERPRISGEKRTHGAGQGPLSGSDKQVCVVRQESPGVYAPRSCPRETRKALDEIVSIRVISKNELPIQASHHYMVKYAGSIQSRATRHEHLLCVLKWRLT
jgi:hypothetical protein